MQTSRSRYVWGLLGFLLLFTTAASAAHAAIVSGLVDSISANTLKIRYISRPGGRTFRVKAGTEIRLDSRKAQLSALPVGARVSVITSRSGSVTKVVARSPKDPVATGVKPMPSQPDRPNTPATSTTNKLQANEGAGKAPWPHFNGPEGNNQSAETGLLKQWPSGGPRLSWTARGLGEGYASVSVTSDRLLTMGTENGREVVIALSLEDGRKLWTTPTGGGVFGDGNGNGPRSTPTIDGEFVYALGAHGDLVCLNLADGKRVWSTNILNQFQGRNITWGISESPLIDGEKLICTPGGSAATVVALNKQNGQVIWRSQVPGRPAAAYASPIVIEVGGVRQYVVFTAKGIVGVRARDGVPMWGDDSSSNGTANCSSPVAIGDRIFSASGYGTGGACVQLRSARGATQSTPLYRAPDMKNHHGGMVAVDGMVYGLSDPGVLTCIDAATGRVRWRDRSVGKGAITFADGHLYVRSEGGAMALVVATPNGYEERGRFEQPERSGRPAWPHPVVADGKLFLRDWDKLLVFDIKQP